MAASSPAPSILHDPSPQFLNEGIGSALPVGVSLDQRIIQTRNEMLIEAGIDMLGFDERAGHRPERQDRRVIHPHSFRAAATGTIGALPGASQ